MADNDLSDLIARLESASEGSEELNKAIAAEVLIAVDAVQLQGSPVYIPMFRYPDGSVGTELRFTQSLDAALTLIQEGWTRSVDATSPDSDIDVTLFDTRYITGGEVSRVVGQHRSEPVATCIAALKARAASSPKGDREPGTASNTDTVFRHNESGAP